ncbi:MAG: sulfite exporter TauE/SafE family protein [Deltaproteobacteria bacterium]|jgi:uncharacterized membrane protein YfcA
MEISGALGLLVPLIGLVTGLLVGATGVGGAALVTPALVLGLGVPVPVAVGSTALFGAVVKLGGVGAHRTALVEERRLLLGSLTGSLPGVALGVFALRFLGDRGDVGLEPILGVLLVVAAAATLASTFRPPASPLFFVPPSALPFAAVPLGFAVGLTGIGAGSLFLPLLLAVARGRPFAGVVAADLAQGLVLATVAGALHLTVGRVDLTLVVALLLGGLPGVWLGARLHRVVAAEKLAGLAASFVGVAGLRLIF